MTEVPEGVAEPNTQGGDNEVEGLPSPVPQVGVQVDAEPLDRRVLTHDHAVGEGDLPQIDPTKPQDEQGNQDGEDK